MSDNRDQSQTAGTSGPGGASDSRTQRGLTRTFRRLDTSPPLGGDLMREGSPWLGRWLSPNLFILLAIFLLFHLFRLTNYSLQIDDELAAMRTSSEVWLLQGRWGAYLFEELVLSNPAIPFVALFLFGLFASIGYLLLLAAHGVGRVGVVHYAVFPLFVAFPTWTHLLAFSANTAAAGLALLFCCGSAYAFHRFLIDRAADARSKWWGFASAAVLAALATGIYQSFIFTAGVLSLGVVLCTGLRSPSGLPALLWQVVWLVGCLAAAVGLYLVLNSLALSLAGLGDGGYVGNIVNLGHFLIDPARAFGTAALTMAGVYSGSSFYFGTRLLGVPVLMLAGIVAVLAVASEQPPVRKFVLMLLAIGVLAMPFMLELFSGGMPVRSMVAVPAVIWLFAAIALTCGVRWIECVASVGLLLSLLNVIYVNNQMQAVDSAVRAHDSHLAADLYRRIAEANDGVGLLPPYPIDVYGGRPFHPVGSRPWSSSWGYSFFEWDGGNLLRMISYMRIQGYNDLVAASPGQRQANLAHFNAMPTWPSMGSVQIVDGVVLIKLSEQPGYPFNVP